MLGANLGAFRRIAPKTVMDALRHIHGNGLVSAAKQAPLIKQRSVVQIQFGASVAALGPILCGVCSSEFTP
jgi:hypothetical protein